MKLYVDRHYIHIAPENPTDVAYIEEVLGLRKDGDTAVAVRDDAMGLSCIAYVEIRKREEAGS